MWNNNDGYLLMEKQVEFENYSNYSYYFLKKKPAEKKYKPVDINGYRYRLDIETGEINNYTRKQIEQSMTQSKNVSKKLLHMLAEMNHFEWFLTFTFDNSKIDRYNNAKVIECYKKFIDNIQKQFPTIKYITVPELHQDGAIHFHMMMSGTRWQDLGLVYSGKVCCSWAHKKNYVCSQEYFEKTKHLHELKETDGLKIYNITKFSYGLTTATRIVNPQACNYYVTKYLDKALGSTEIFQKRFYYSKNLNVPNIVKRQVGAEFEKPKKLLAIADVLNSDAMQNCNHPYYNKEHNVLCCNLVEKQIIETQTKMEI